MSTSTLTCVVVLPPSPKRCALLCCPLIPSGMRGCFALFPKAMCVVVLPPSPRWHVWLFCPLPKTYMRGCFAPLLHRDMKVAVLFLVRSGSVLASSSVPGRSSGSQFGSLGSPVGSWGLIFAPWGSQGRPRGVLGRSLGVPGGSLGAPGASLVGPWGLPVGSLGEPGGSWHRSSTGDSKRANSVKQSSKTGRGILPQQRAVPDFGTP